MESCKRKNVEEGDAQKGDTVMKGTENENFKETDGEKPDEEENDNNVIDEETGLKMKDLRILMGNKSKEEDLIDEESDSDLEYLDEDLVIHEREMPDEDWEEDDYTLMHLFRGKNKMGNNPFSHWNQDIKIIIISSL